MLLVKTYVDKSTIHGVGIFAYEDISKGSKIYVPSPGLDLELTPEQFSKLDKNDQKVIKHYGYVSKLNGKYYLAYDNIRFCNHSSDPNIVMQGFGYIAKRDIKKGEELLCDYSEFENLREL